MGKNNFEPRNKFERWVRQFGGAKKLSKALKVSQPSVQNWLKGYCLPGLKAAIAIVKLADGKLSFEDIAKVQD